MKMVAAIPVLPVTHIERSLAFYRDELGFTVRHQDAGFAVLRRDAIQVHLWTAADDQWRSRANAEPVVSGAESFIAGTASCVLQVDRVDEFYQHLKTKGALQSRSTLTNQPWGTRDFSIVDPDNNLITFFERLAPAADRPSDESVEQPAEHAAPDDSADL